MLKLFPWPERTKVPIPVQQCRCVCGCLWLNLPVSFIPQVLIVDLCADKFLQEVSDKGEAYVTFGDIGVYRHLDRKYVEVLREHDSGKTSSSYPSELTL